MTTRGLAVYHATRPDQSEREASLRQLREKYRIFPSYFVRD